MLTIFRDVTLNHSEPDPVGAVDPVVEVEVRNCIWEVSMKICQNLTFAITSRLLEMLALQFCLWNKYSISLPCDECSQSQIKYVI